MKRREFLIRKKKSYAELAKIYGKTVSSVCETVKKEEKIHASFAVTSQIAKVMAAVHETCSANLEEAWHLYRKIFWETDHIHVTFVTVHWSW